MIILVGGECKRWTDVKKTHTPVCFRTIDSRANNVSNVLCFPWMVFSQHIWYLIHTSALVWCPLSYPSSLLDSLRTQALDRNQALKAPTLVSGISCPGEPSVIIWEMSIQGDILKNGVSLQGASDSHGCSRAPLVHLVHQPACSRAGYKLPHPSEWVS